MARGDGVGGKVGLSSSIIVLAKSAVQAAGPADTNENALATITVPAGIMGLNGWLEIWTLWEFTNNANVKTLRVRFSGIAGTQFMSLNAAGTGYLNRLTTISNRNSAASQIAEPSGNTAFQTTVAGGLTTATENTAVDTTVVISCQKATAGDTINLARYLVKLYPGA